MYRMILALIIAAFAMPFSAFAQAPLEVEVRRGGFKRMPVAVPYFEARTPDLEALARQVSEIIRDDLNSSGLFEVKDPRAYIQRDLTIDTVPRFLDWKLIKADFVLAGALQRRSDGSLEFLCRLWDVYGEEQMMVNGMKGWGFVISQQNMRAGAHMVADDIYERITGEKGYFDSDIVFVAESGPKTERVKRLAIMDSDGENFRYLPVGGNSVLTPRYSPSSHVIVYTSFVSDRPRVYLYDVAQNRQEMLGDIANGMSFGPRFTTDGNGVLFTQASSGNSDIYLMNLRTRRTEQLTKNPAIDTSPSMSPDGDHFVFTSDRGGSPQIYKKRIDGRAFNCPSGNRASVCRITFGQGSYSTPVWSPRGDLIAFTKQLSGKFYIGVIGSDGKAERLLTNSYLVEAPEWSPNGRIVTFLKEVRAGRGPRIWSIDISGQNERELPTSTDASDPTWSPLHERLQ